MGTKPNAFSQHRQRNTMYKSLPSNYPRNSSHQLAQPVASPQFQSVPVHLHPQLQATFNGGPQQGLRTEWRTPTTKVSRVAPPAVSKAASTHPLPDHRKASHPPAEVALHSTMPPPTNRSLRLHHRACRLVRLRRSGFSRISNMPMADPRRPWDSLSRCTLASVSRRLYRRVSEVHSNRHLKGFLDRLLELHLGLQGLLLPGLRRQGMADMEGDGRLMFLGRKVPVRMLLSLRSDFHLLCENLNERWTKVCRIVAVCISTVSFLFAFLLPV